MAFLVVVGSVFYILLSDRLGFIVCSVALLVPSVGLRGALAPEPRCALIATLVIHTRSTSC